jgi:hypothetical protein
MHALVLLRRRLQGLFGHRSEVWSEIGRGATVTLRIPLRTRLEVEGRSSLDGVGAAVKLVEALVGLGLRTSKQGDLAYPIIKPYTGSLAQYAAPRAIKRTDSAKDRLIILAETAGSEDPPSLLVTADLNTRFSVSYAHNAVPEGATGIERRLHMPPL